MNQLTKQTAHIFRGTGNYNDLTSEEEIIFLNLPENYQNDSFREMCWEASGRKCIVTDENIDLNKTTENTNNQSHRFGNYLSIEHISAQAVNKNTNLIGNLIPIKGNLNSSIGTLHTEEYLKQTLMWDGSQMDEYHKRVLSFRRKLFISMKNYYQNDIFIKYDPEEVQKQVDIYSFSAYTNNLKTIADLAEAIGITLGENISAKREVYKITKTFSIYVNKLTKAESCLIVERENIKRLLETKHSIKHIANSFNIKAKDLQIIIADDMELAFINNTSEEWNAVISGCEKHSEEIMALVEEMEENGGKANIKKITQDFELFRKNEAVGMFIHMQKKIIALEKQSGILNNSLDDYNGISDIANYISEDVKVTKFTHDVNLKMMKLTLEVE